MTVLPSRNALPPDRVNRARYFADRSTIWQASDLPDRVFRLKSGRVHIVGVTAGGEE